MNRKPNKQIHEELISSMPAPEFTRKPKGGVSQVMSFSAEGGKCPQLAPMAECKCNEVGISQIMIFRAEDVSIDPETNEAIISGAPVFILGPNPTISFDFGGSISFDFEAPEDDPEDEE